MAAILNNFIPIDSRNGQLQSATKFFYALWTKYIQKIYIFIFFFKENDKFFYYELIESNQLA